MDNGNDFEMPTPPTSEEEVEDSVEETESADDKIEKIKAKKAGKSKSKLKAKSLSKGEKSKKGGKPVAKKSGNKSRSLTVQIEIPRSSVVLDELRFDMAKEACRKQFHDFRSLAEVIRVTPTTARHYIQQIAHLPEAEITMKRGEGRVARGVPSLHVKLPRAA